MARLVAGVLALACLTSPALAAELQVTSEPPGGAVFLDDRYLGATPLTVDVAAEGQHLLRIEKRGFLHWRGTVELAPDAAQVAATLAREPSGQVTVQTEPEGAEVLVDGQAAGRSPVSVADLKLGAHQVQVTKPGYSPVEQAVVLSVEEPHATVQVTLSGLIEEYLTAHVEAHPEDVMALTDLAHELALRQDFDACLDAMAKAFDGVSVYGEELDQDAIRRVYQEVERLHSKQFEYGPDEAVAALRPRLIEAVRAAIDRHPSNGYNYEALGALLAASAGTDAAIEVYTSGAGATDVLPVRLRLLGSAGQALYSKATAFEKAENWDAAVEAHEGLVTRFPGLWCAENSLGRLATIYGQHMADQERAVAAVDRLLTQIPDSPDGFQALYRLAAYLFKAQDYEAAVATYLEIADRFPDNEQTSAMLTRAAGVCEKQLADPERALATWRKLIELAGTAPEGASARRRAAALLRKQGDEAGALALEDEIRRDFPLSADAIYIEKDIEKRKYHNAARKAYNEAAALLKAGKHQEAADRCVSLIEEYGDHYYSVQAQQYIVSIWLNAKDYDKLVAAREAFVLRWPEHESCPEHLYQIASCLENQIGDLPRAIEAYQRCIDTYPQHHYTALSLYQVAQMWMQNPAAIDYERSRDAFLRLARDFPQSQYALMARKYAGDCQMQLRDPEKARAIYMELMQEHPNTQAAYNAATYYRLVRMRKDEE